MYIFVKLSFICVTEKRLGWNPTKIENITRTAEKTHTTLWCHLFQETYVYTIISPVRLRNVCFDDRSVEHVRINIYKQLYKTLIQVCNCDKINSNVFKKLFYYRKSFDIKDIYRKTYAVTMGQLLRVRMALNALRSLLVQRAMQAVDQIHQRPESNLNSFRVDKIIIFFINLTFFRRELSAKK